MFTIKEGKNIEENDKNSIIVHEEFAKQNNLKLGHIVEQLMKSRLMEVHIIKIRLV